MENTSSHHHHCELDLRQFLKNKYFIANLGIIIVVLSAIPFSQNQNTLGYIFFTTGALLNAPVAIQYLASIMQRCFENKSLNFIIKLALGLTALFIWPFSHSMANDAISSVTRVDAANFPYSFAFTSVIETVLLWVIFVTVFSLLLGLVHHIYVDIRNGHWPLFPPFDEHIHKLTSAKQSLRKTTILLLKMARPLPSFNIFIGCTALYLCGVFLTNTADKDINHHSDILRQLIVNIDFTDNYFCKNLPRGEKINVLQYGLFKHKVLIAKFDKHTNRYDFSISSCQLS